MAKRKTVQRRPDARPLPGVDGLRASLAAAEAAARQCADAERRVREELEVYQEEASQQTRQLVEANLALETSHERYVSLYDYAPVAFVSLDHNGIINDLNLAAADLLGAERERLLKMPMLTFVHADSRRPFLNHMLRCRRSQIPAKTEIMLHNRGGGAVPVLLATWFGVPRGGPGWEFRSALIDLTDRKAAEAQEATYQKRLSSLASELSLAEERERRRIAVEIHDNLSQNLALIKMKLGMLRQKAAQPEVSRGLEEVAGLLDPVLERTRSLTFELSPPVLYELGLEPALEWLAERMAAQHRLDVRVEKGRKADRLASPVPHDVAVLLFQAVRELLMNVVKHAGARRATVRCERGADTASVTVSDDGRGFEPVRAMTPPRSAAPNNGGGRGGPAAAGDGGVGFGLFSIRTRLEHMGGRMGVRTEPGRGAEITLTVPFHPGTGSAAESAAGAAGEKPDGKARPDRRTAHGHTSTPPAYRRARPGQTVPDQDGHDSSPSAERSTQ